MMRTGVVQEHFIISAACNSLGEHECPMLKRFPEIPDSPLDVPEKEHVLGDVKLIL